MLRRTRRLFRHPPSPGRRWRTGWSFGHYWVIRAASFVICSQPQNPLQPALMHRSTNLAEDETLRASSRSTLEIVRRVVVYLRPYRGLALANMACALVSLGFSLAFPQFIQVIIEDVIHGKTTRYLWLVAGLAAAFLLRDAFNSLRIFVNNIFEQNVIYDM